MAMSDVRESLKLSQTLLGVHRAVYVDFLRTRGLGISESDDLSSFDDLDYGDDVPANIKFESNWHQSVIPLLGNRYLKLIRSWTTEEYMEEHLQKLNTYSHSRDVLAPCKTLRLGLTNRLPGAGQQTDTEIGHMLIGPDGPPVVIHDNDVKYIFKKYHNAENISLRYGTIGATVVAAIEADFGEDAAVKLPADTAMLLRHALVSDNPQIDN